MSVHQQKQKLDASELSVLGAMFFSGPTACASCRCGEESSYRRRYTCFESPHHVSDYSLYSKLSVCVAYSPYFGAHGGDKRIRTIPATTKIMQIVNAFRAGS